MPQAPSSPEAPPAVRSPSPPAVIQFLDCLGKRGEAARALAASIDAGDAARAAAQQQILAELGARLPGLQSALGFGGAGDAIARVRQLIVEIKEADAAVSAALLRSQAPSLALWLQIHGQVADAAIESLLAAPWDRNRDLVALVGQGSVAVADRLLARGQGRVMCVDPSQPETPPTYESLEATKWNVHGQEGIESMASLMTWPLPSQVRVLEVGPRSPWGAPELQKILGRALEFAGFEQLQILERAGYFAHKATRNLAAIASVPSVSSLRGALTGLPAIVVSAGPSLDKNLAQLGALAGRAVIIAINQTVKSLRREKIRADIAIAIDPLDVSYHFEGVQPGEIGTLVLGASVDPSLYRIPADRVVTLSSSPMVEQWIYEILGEEAAVGSGSTVSTGAIKLAAWLGCTTIISMGRDLALAGDKYYASSAADGSQTLAPAGDGRFRFAVQGPKLRLAEKGGDLQAVLDMIEADVYDMRQVPGFFGAAVTTTQHFAYEMERLRRVVGQLRADVRFINATEGGAFLDGMEHMPLAEAAATLPAGPIDTEARLQERLRDVDIAARRTRMRQAIGPLAADLAALLRAARSAHDVAGREGRVEVERREQAIEEIKRVSRNWTFLSILVQNATRPLVKRGGPDFQTLDDVAQAERALFGAIVKVADALLPEVQGAVTTLSPG